MLVKTRITTASELVTFSKALNSGAILDGVTVFLNDNIDFSDDVFSGQFEPIGNSLNNSFQGTFYGQGSIISNLRIISSRAYANEATIRSAVLDSSCSALSECTGLNDTYVGGIIGHCTRCIIENSVNMASANFTGRTSDILCLGGIAGELYSDSKNVITKNCANYGSVTHSGTVNKNIHVCGVIGRSR